MSWFDLLIYRICIKELYPTLDVRVILWILRQVDIRILACFFFQYIKKSFCLPPPSFKRCQQLFFGAGIFPSYRSQIADVFHTWYDTSLFGTGPALYTKSCFPLGWINSSYWRIYWYLTADFGNEIKVSRWLRNFSRISIKTKFTKINTMVWWINR